MPRTQPAPTLVVDVVIHNNNEQPVEGLGWSCGINMYRQTERFLSWHGPLGGSAACLTRGRG